MSARDPVLRIDDLHTNLHLRAGTLRAVDGFSCTLHEGETLGIVGESGCGKSMLALSILRLVPEPLGKIGGEGIYFRGRNLLELDEAGMLAIRGNDIAMIFQEPMTSLNPVVTIGRQIGETIMLHQGLGKEAARQKTIEMLRLVHISEPERRLNDYPHRMSGGMRQRVMIAMALSCNPKVLLADEPTTALDVTIQAQILDLLAELQERLGTAIILITHDMGVIAEHADRVAVMYAGRKVEEAPVDDLFAAPMHPYTQGLLGSIPRIDLADAGRRRLSEIGGVVPPLHSLPPGCAFAPRCAFASERCRRKAPPLEAKRPEHLAACWQSDRLHGAAA
jgi:peptide/nickel transport system ATP-binding protein